MNINSHIIPLEGKEGRQHGHCNHIDLKGDGRESIDRTASTCVNPNMVKGLTDRCDGTTPRSLFNIIVVTDNTLWQRQ